MDIAAAPGAPFKYGLPGRVWLDFTRPADSLLPGVVPAHEARCLAVGKRLMSTPVSATTTSAVLAPIPGIEQIRSWKPRKGSIKISIRAVSWSIAAVCWSMRLRWTRTRKA